MAKKVANGVLWVMAVVIWSLSVGLFFFSSGRFSGVIAALYQGATLQEAFRSLANRPIPTDYLAVLFGAVLSIAWIMQISFYKKGWLAIQFLSTRLFVLGCIFLFGQQALSYGLIYTDRFLFIDSSVCLLLILAYMVIGITGLTFIINRGLQKLTNGEVAGPSYLVPLNNAAVWINMSTFLTAVQLVFIVLLRCGPSIL